MATGRKRGPKPGTRVDWFRILADLKRAGLSTQKVAQLITEQDRAGDPNCAGCSDSMLAYYGQGGEPPFYRGHQLLALWLQHVKHDTTTAPMMAKDIPRIR